jgi:hypothetical protein
MRLLITFLGRLGMQALTLPACIPSFCTMRKNLTFQEEMETSIESCIPTLSGISELGKNAVK